MILRQTTVPVKVATKLITNPKQRPTTSDSDSDTRSVTSSDNNNGTESGNDADDECLSTTTENGSRRSSFSLSDNDDADVTEDATVNPLNDEEEPAAAGTQSAGSSGSNARER